MAPHTRERVRSFGVGARPSRSRNMLWSSLATLSAVMLLKIYAFLTRMTFGLHRTAPR